MSKQPDIDRAIQQHIELEEFFAGDFTRKTPIPVELSEELMATDSAAGLRKIEEEVHKCRKCELGQTRISTVPGEGCPDARIMFIGEAPGAEEDDLGRPFVGSAGKLFEKILGAMGLKRSEVFICNILKCRPPGNRNPKPEEVASCLAYLNRQIELIDPEVIVALGAQATKTLLGVKTAIGQLRGRFQDYYTSEDAEPIKLMPTYHPAYLRRNYSVDNRTNVWEDMKKVLIELEMPVPQAGKK